MTDREIMQQVLDAYDDHEPLTVVMEELRDRLAQPEQEPVAWMVIGDGKYGEYTPGMYFDTVGYKEYWERRGYELQPLYTAPPKRKPLTDNELADLWYKQSLDWLEFGRAVQAAHGIKENT